MAIASERSELPLRHSKLFPLAPGCNPSAIQTPRNRKKIYRAQRVFFASGPVASGQRNRFDSRFSHFRNSIIENTVTRFVSAKSGVITHYDMNRKQNGLLRQKNFHSIERGGREFGCRGDAKVLVNKEQRNIMRITLKVNVLFPCRKLIVKMRCP